MPPSPLRMLKRVMKVSPNLKTANNICFPQMATTTLIPYQHQSKNFQAYCKISVLAFWTLCKCLRCLGRILSFRCNYVCVHYTCLVMCSPSLVRYIYKHSWPKVVRFFWTQSTVAQTRTVCNIINPHNWFKKIKNCNVIDATDRRIESVRPSTQNKLL